MEPNTVLWILAGFLALLFLGTGMLKVTRSREQIVAAGLGWAEDYSESSLRAIGWAELLGAAGLVLPALLGVAPLLVPVAAAALAVLTAGAVVVHVRRGELSETLRTLALLALCVVLAVYRFGPEAF